MPLFRKKRTLSSAVHIPLRGSKSSGNTDLFQLVADGKSAVLYRYLGDLSEAVRRDKFNHRDRTTGATLLHQAVKAKNSSILDMLITLGADPSAKDNMGSTPLHYVARFVRPEKRRSVALNCEDSASLMIQTLVAVVGVNDIDSWGMTALHHASLSGNAHVVRCLLPYPSVDKEATDKQGRTALHNAATLGDLEIVHMLVQQGANVYATDKKGLTAVHIAAKEGNLDVIRLLCGDHPSFEYSALEDRGHLPSIHGPSTADLLSKCDKQQLSPLHYAVENNHLDIVRYLLEHGVDPNVKSTTNLAPLHLAAIHSSVHVCQLLVQHGASVESLAEENKTPLLLASLNGEPSIVSFLLDQGAGIEDCDIEGNTPLLCAVDSGNVDVVRILLERRANVACRNTDGYNVLHTAVLSKNASALQELLKTPAAKKLINTGDGDGDTPLHHAAKNAFLDIVQMLLENGALPSARNNSDETTLHSASTYNFPNVVREIIHQDKKLVNAMDVHWNTPLHVAAQGGFSEIVALLVDSGADLEAKNYYEWTPLTVACRAGDFDTVSNLLVAGASVFTVDKMKNIPLHIAAQYGNDKIVNLLLGRKDVKDFVARRNANKHNCLDIAIAGDHRTVVEVLLKSAFWKELLQNATDSERYGIHQTPLRRLIRSMPDLATLVFDNCVAVKAESEDDPEKTVTYCYEFLDDAFMASGEPDSDDEGDSSSTSSSAVFRIYDEYGRVIPSTQLYSNDFGTLKSNHPLMIMANEKRRALLGHELCKSLLVHKWKSYGRYVYYGTMSFYVLFLACLTFFTIGTPAPCPAGFPHFNTTCSHIAQHNSCSVIGEASDEGKYKQTEFARAGKTIIFIVSVVFLLKELFQMYNTRLNYLHLENLSEWCCYVSSLLFVTNFTECSSATGVPEPWQWHLGVVSIFLSWMLLVLYIRKLPFLGIYVVMFTNVLSTFSQFFLVFFLFNVAFALAFFALLQNQAPFETPWKAIMKTSVMMVGELEYDTIFYENVVPYETSSYILTALFLVLMTIITSNLLVGLAVDDIKGVLEQAELQRLSMQVKLVLTVETMLPTWARRRIVVQRRTVKPNRKSQAHTLLRRLFGITFTSSRRTVSEEKFTVEKLYEHQEAMDRMLRHLEDRLNILTQQGHRLEKAMNSISKHLEKNSANPSAENVSVLSGQETAEK